MSRSEGLEPINKFKAFTRIGANGTVEEMRIFGNGPAAVCMYGKLREFQKENATAFPRPPYSPYWIRLDLDAAEFAPVQVVSRSIDGVRHRCTERPFDELGNYLICLTLHRHRS